MRVHTSSKNQRSCVTTKSAPCPCRQRRFKCPASHVMARTSRWLVGSSSASTSQSPMSRRTRSTRRRWPPESVPTRAFQGMSEASPAMMSRTRASPAHWYSGMSPTTARSTVSSSDSASACPSTPTCTAPFFSTRPSSGSSEPANRAKSVDFPSPLRPTMPTRSPSSTPSDTLSNTVFVGNSTRTFSQPSINAIEHLPPTQDAQRLATCAFDHVSCCKGTMNASHARPSKRLPTACPFRTNTIGPGRSRTRKRGHSEWRELARLITATPHRTTSAAHLVEFWTILQARALPARNRDRIAPGHKATQKRSHPDGRARSSKTRPNWQRAHLPRAPHSHRSARLPRSLAPRPYAIAITATTKATVTTRPPATMAHTAGRAKFRVQPTPKRSGKNRLASSGLQ